MAAGVMTGKGAAFKVASPTLEIEVDKVGVSSDTDDVKDRTTSALGRVRHVAGFNAAKLTFEGYWDAAKNPHLPALRNLRGGSRITNALLELIRDDPVMRFLAPSSVVEKVGVKIAAAGRVDLSVGLAVDGQLIFPGEAGAAPAPVAPTPGLVVAGKGCSVEIWPDVDNAGAGVPGVAGTPDFTADPFLLEMDEASVDDTCELVTTRAMNRLGLTAIDAGFVDSVIAFKGYHSNATGLRPHQDVGLRDGLLVKHLFFVIIDDPDPKLGLFFYFPEVLCLSVKDPVDAAARADFEFSGVPTLGVFWPGSPPVWP